MATPVKNPYEIERHLADNLNKNLLSLDSIKSKLDKNFYEQALKLNIENRGLAFYDPDALIAINKIQLANDMSEVSLDIEPDFSGFSEKIGDKHHPYNPYKSTVYKNAHKHLYMRLKDTYNDRYVHIETL